MKSDETLYLGDRKDILFSAPITIFDFLSPLLNQSLCLSKEAIMKSFLLASALAVQQIAAHSIFQQLWVDGVDKGSTCIRMPGSNSPVTNVGSNDIRCNVGVKSASSKCAVNAGGTVTVEMHAQPGDRNCKNEAIGGNHYGPVLVYMTKVADAATADGSTGWCDAHSVYG